jgi:hypothetical protein
MFKPAAHASTALAVVGLFALAACGDEDSTPARATAVPATASATALQNQLVRVVDAVSPEVVQLQCGLGLGSGGGLRHPWRRRDERARGGRR